MGKWRKESDIEYVMVLPHNWRLRVLWCNGHFWMWQLHAGRLIGSVIHGYAPKTVDEREYQTAAECKAAAVDYARTYFREMLESVSA